MIKIGWLGLAFLLIAYIFLNTKFEKTFMILSIIGCILFTIHATILKDLPFIILNSFIGLMWLVKLIKKKGL